MSNKDRLEDFIADNRVAFDHHMAPDGLWEKIESDIRKNNPKPWNWTLIALAIGVIGIAAVLFYQYGKVEEIIEPEVDYLYAQFEDYTDTENYFVMQSNFLWNEIRKMHTDATLEKDLSLLDENEKVLRQELENIENDSREYIIRAILKNQEIKMNLLKSVLEEIKQKNVKNENHEVL